MADNGNNVLDGLYLLAKSIPNKKAQAKAYILNIIGNISSVASVAWADITGKPTTFPPENHTHVEADIIDLGLYVEEAPIDGTAYARQDATWVAGGGGYTNEQAQDAVGTILTDTATIDFTYTDATPSITADVKASSITEAMQNLSDNTTADVTTSRHGYVPKAPNDTTKFLRGDATWADIVNSKPATREIWMSKTDFMGRSPAATELLLATYQQAYVWNFSGSAFQCIMGAFRVPEDWDGTAITIKLYLASSGTSTNNTRWGFNIFYQRATTNLDRTPPDLSFEETIVPVGVLEELWIHNLGTTATPAAIGDILNILIYRNATDAIDTNTNNIYLYGVGFKFNTLY